MACENGLGKANVNSSWDGLAKSDKMDEQDWKDASRLRTERKIPTSWVQPKGERGDDDHGLMEIPPPNELFRDFVITFDKALQQVRMCVRPKQQGNEMRLLSRAQCAMSAGQKRTIVSSSSKGFIKAVKSNRFRRANFLQVFSRPYVYQGTQKR